ncbi:MAG TPA: hypothetical protein PLQ97_14255 [Myxococcota bacterium]|nr:hypothetical protein [Myxococcota bacterium]HQK52431.1 hypothetical protein [Myxococcota bacterium]
MAMRRIPVVGWLAVLALWGCSSRIPTPASAPPTVPEPDQGPLGPALWQGGRGLRWNAETTIQVLRDGEDPQEIKDLRQMDRTPEGDYRVVVRRRVPLSAGGVAEETFTVIAVGSSLWTRGSGGPFVAWEDPAAPIREFEGIALQGTRDLWRIATLCGRPRSNEGPGRREFHGETCEIPVGSGGVPGRVERLDLQVDDPGGEFRGLWARVEWTVPGEAGPVTVRLEHRARREDLPPGEAPRPPEEVVSGRRDRPVRMVRQVLSGLGDWGPGAPWREKDPGVPGTP